MSGRTRGIVPFPLCPACGGRGAQALMRRSDGRYYVLHTIGSTTKRCEVTPLQYAESADGIADMAAKGARAARIVASQEAREAPKGGPITLPHKTETP